MQQNQVYSIDTVHLYIHSNFWLQIDKNVDFTAKKTVFLKVFCLFLNMGFSKNKILQKPTPPTFFNVLSCKFQKVLETLFLCYVTKLFFEKKILGRATPIFRSLDVQTPKNGRGSAQNFFFKK